MVRNDGNANPASCVREWTPALSGPRAFCRMIPATRGGLAEERGDLSFMHVAGSFVAELPEKLMSCRFLPMNCCFLAQAAPQLLGTCSRGTPSLGGGRFSVVAVPGGVVASPLLVHRTPRISCEAVPPSVSPTGAQGGTSACSTGAALSFVSS
jgi:hypothetical protein